MADRICSVKGCEREDVIARGWCWLHYGRWRRQGDPLAEPAPRTPAPVMERLWRHIVVSEAGCWEWTGANDKGYGRITVDKKARITHRLMYELTVGPIPQGLQLDHLCRNPPCCNPSHLEPVTPLENTRRGMGNGSQTHCPQGHPYAGENLYEYQGRRYCNTCRRRHVRNWYAKQKAS